MSDFELVAVNSIEQKIVPCWKCEKEFKPELSEWCSCDSKLRTLKCPHCSNCFCQAPFPYKKKFWTAAPKALRESPQRFGIAARQPRESDLEPAAPLTGSQPQPRVLIVDDEEPIRSLAACYVEQIGYQVTTVSSPEEALLLTQPGAFDVVLTDALMPNMDGRELCRQLKATHGDKLKVVLMTSLYTARHFRTEARHVFKVDEHLAKPLRFAELRDALLRVAPLALTA